MTEVKKNRDGGGSPGSRLLQDLAIAIARADAPRISSLVTEDVRWSPVDRKPVTGADAFCKAVTRYGRATRLEVERVVSDGKAGAVHGVVEYGRKRRAYCLVCEFRDANTSEVSRITSFSVALG